MSRSLTSLVVNQLVQRDLVTSMDDRQDRRNVMLRLTPQGQAMIERLYPGCWIGLDTHLANLEVGDLVALHRALQALDIARDP